MKNKVLGLLLIWVGLFFVSSAMASELVGSVAVKRDNARRITAATLKVGDRVLNIVMDENGKSLAQYYEHKDVRVSGSISGDNIKVSTWKEEKSNYFQSDPYVEPEPEPEYDDDADEQPADDSDEAANNNDDNDDSYDDDDRYNDDDY